jgi:hypothetical protein
MKEGKLPSRSNQLRARIYCEVARKERSMGQELAVTPPLAALPIAGTGFLLPATIADQGDKAADQTRQAAHAWRGR